MKNKLLVLIFGIFLISLVSSTTINDVKDYDEDTKTALIKDSVLGDVKQELVLRSKQIEAVGLGYQKVAEFQITNYEATSYDKVVKSIEAFDISGNKLIKKTKTFDLKYQIEVVDERPIYETIDVQDKNGTWYTEQNLTGYEEYTYYAWEDFTSNELLSGQTITMSIWTTTYEGEYAEWIPTFSLGKDYEISEWASWTASLNTNLVAYYAFEEGTGTTTRDSLGRYNLTGFGTPGWTTAGKIGNATNLSSASSEYWKETTASGNFSFNNSFTINCWAKDASWTNYQVITALSTEVASGGTRWMIYANATYSHYTGYSRTTGPDTAFVGNITTGTWNMLTFQRNTTGLYGFKNGAFINYTLTTTLDPIVEKHEMSIGAVKTDPGNAWQQFYNGIVDECGMWDRQLTQAEITHLYNGGDGITYSTNSAPNVTLNLPVNTTNLTVSNYNFNGTVSDDINLTNVSFKIDGVIQSTNTSGLNNSLYNFLYSGLSNGAHNWSLLAYDNSSQSTEVVRHFNVSVTAPIVTLQSPVDTYNTTSLTNTFIGFVTSPDPLVNVSLVQNGSIIASTTNVSGTNHTNYSFSGNFPDGTHTWNIIACDAQNDCGIGTTRTIRVDTIDPTIAIISPLAVQGYGEAGYTEYLNWSINDTNINMCWYDYNGINTTITCSGSNTTTFVLTGAKTITIWANDTFGRTSYATRSWEYQLFLNDVDYNANAYETAQESFLLNASVNSSTNAATARLFYKGEYYDTDITTGGLTFNASSLINIPLGAANNSFHWVVTLSYNSGDVVLNTSSFYQNVTTISLTDCSSGNISLFFTSKSEINQTTLNDLDFDGTFWYWLGDGDIQKNVSITKSGVTNVSICFNLLGAANYSLDSDIAYSATDYSTRNYYYDNATISSRQNVTLYSLDDLESTSFIVSLKDGNYFAIPEALVYFKRWYAGNGTSETVGMIKTDDNGVSVIPLQEDVADYDIVVIKDGEVLYLTTDHQKVYCTSTPCTYPIITSDSGFTGWTPIGQVNNLEFSDITLNETSNIVSIEYVDTSGGISYFRLVVYSESPAVGRVEICDTNSTSSAATLTCNVTGYTGTLYAQAYLSRSPESLVWAKTFFLNTIKDIVGTEGLFLSMFILLIVGFGGALVGGPTGGIIGVIVSVMFIPLLQIASFGPVFIWGIIIGGIFLIWNLKG